MLFCNLPFTLNMFSRFTHVVGSYSTFICTVVSIALFTHLSEEEKVTIRIEVSDLERENSS